MQNVQLSLRTILIGILVVLNIMAASVIGLLLYLNSETSSSLMATHIQREIFGKVTHYIGDMLNQAEKINENNANLIRHDVVSTYDPAKIQYMFWQQIQVFKSISNISFGTPEGGLVGAGRKIATDDLFFVDTIGLSSGTLRIFDVDEFGTREALLYRQEGFDARERPWFMNALGADGNTWSKPYMLPTETSETISVNFAVRDYNHSLLGVLSTNIFISHFNAYLRSIENRENGQIYIFDSSKNLLASSLPEPTDDEQAQAELVQQLRLKDHILKQTILQSGREEGHVTTSFGNQKYHVYAAQLLPETGLGWYVVIEFPEHSFMPGLRNNNNYALLTIFVILGLTIIIGFLAAKVIAAPIKTLENSARKIARGIWHNNNIPKTRIREIDSLAASFQNMSSTLEQVVLEFQQEINVRRTAEDNLKANEAALRVSNEMYQKLTTSAKDAIIQMNSAGEVVFWNHAAETIFGYSAAEAATMKVHQVLAQDGDFQNFSRAFPQFIAHGTGAAIGRTLELEAIHKDGHLIPVELSLSTFIDKEERQALAIIRDISDRKRAEKEYHELQEQLRQKYKMEAIGLLAGGIAHNFNNNLAIILGNVEMAKHEAVSPEDSAILLDHAYTAARRSSDLVKKIMIYSRADSFEAEPVQLRLIIQETLTLLYSTLPTSVMLESEFCEDANKLFIDADLSSIQEILINLCNNAIHAMDESGKLTVTLDRAEIQEADIPAQFQCLPGPYARISVRDTGIGMSEQVMAKIFDPFFTTKDVDKGTGMGLAAVMGAVNNYGGMIKVTSEVGVGSCFEAYFPLIDLNEPGQSDKDISVYKGCGNILLIEDDALVAETSANMLDDLGYQVTVETDSVKALERVTKAPFKFDLVITDQTMPNMTGIEFAQQVETINPTLPIILCTGYSTKISEKNYEQFNIKAFCVKPLGTAEFSQVINKVMASPADG